MLRQVDWNFRIVGGICFKVVPRQQASAEDQHRQILNVTLDLREPRASRLVRPLAQIMLSPLPVQNWPSLCGGHNLGSLWGDGWEGNLRFN